MEISPALLGLIRGLGFTVTVAVLSYLGVAEHLSFLNPATAAIVATIALSIEHMIEGKTGSALFGAARTA